jgi:2-methylaconitate cis-trans-isomerase PrpF
MANDLISIPCVLMRGGTSKGPFFLASDLPADPVERDRLLMTALGSGHPLQIDGVGGGNPLSSKVAIIKRSERPDADVEYSFTQVGVEERIVDSTPNCGNMLAAVGPFAIEAGLVTPQRPETLVRIFNVNSGKIIEARVPTRDGRVNYLGNTAIAGVPGTGAPISLSFVDAAGSVTGSLLPSGLPKEDLCGIEATLIDCAIPMVHMRASDFGLTGGESPAQLNETPGLLERLHDLRVEAGRRMGIHGAEHRVVPKPVLLSVAPDGRLRVRYFVPDQCHLALATTGAIGIATACATSGTLAAEMIGTVKVPATVGLVHPQGVLEVSLSYGEGSQGIRAGVVRTARRLFDGRVFVRPPGCEVDIPTAHIATTLDSDPVEA